MNAFNFLSENFALIAETKKKKGRLFGERTLFFHRKPSIMGIALYSFQLFILYGFLTIVLRCFNGSASRSGTILNGPCIRVMVIQ